MEIGPPQGPQRVRSLLSIVCMSHPEFVYEASSISGLLRKFKLDGFESKLTWLHGIFQAGWCDCREIINTRPPCPDPETEDDADVHDKSSQPSLLGTRRLPMAAFSLSSTAIHNSQSFNSTGTQFHKMTIDGFTELYQIQLLTLTSIPFIKIQSFHMASRNIFPSVILDVYAAAYVTFRFPGYRILLIRWLVLHCIAVSTNPHLHNHLKNLNRMKRILKNLSLSNFSK